MMLHVAKSDDLLFASKGAQWPKFSLAVRLHNSLLLVSRKHKMKNIKETTFVQELDRWENNLLASVGP